MRNIKDEFKSLRGLILYVLENYPETRDSDNALFVQCCRELGAETLDDIESTKHFNLVSMHKERQKIQNKEKLFVPSDQVKELRKERRKGIRTYMKEVN